MLLRVFFFFKQKTAYEVRISDWSSDVCSSDLHIRHQVEHLFGRVGKRPCFVVPGHRLIGRPSPVAPRGRRAFRRNPCPHDSWTGSAGWTPPAGSPRSEEHTSELQSLMRISYAVFCLKKKIHSHSKPKNYHS